MSRGKLFLVIFVLVLVAVTIVVVYCSSTRPRHLPNNYSSLSLQTFADGKKYTTDRLLREAKNSDYFHPNRMYAAGPADLDKNFLTKHARFMAENKRGWGYWIWKPQIILSRLEQMPEGQVLLWLDSGFQILPTFADMVRKWVGMTETILCFTVPGLVNPESRFTKMDLANHYAPELDHSYPGGKQAFLKSSQLQSGSIFFRKCPATLEVVRRWQRDMEIYHLISDAPSVAPNSANFEEHRHDQSVFSVVMKINLARHRITDDYSDSPSAVGRPFIAKRIMANGMEKYNK